MGPFDLLVPEPAGRFLGEPPRNAYVELHNLIAAAASAAEFGPADRVRISRRHGVDLAREFLAERQALYQRLLDDRLADADLDAEDRHLLAHVAQTLALSAADLRPVHRRAFGAAAADAVADDCLEVEERLLLYKLQHLLGLDPRLADGAYAVIARERLLRVVAEALCDGELSPDEEAEIERVRAALSLDLPDELRRMLDASRDRWALRRGEMPRCDVPVELKKGEVGRFHGWARWSRVDAAKLDAHVGAYVLESGRTSGRALPPHTLTGRMEVGEVALTDRRLVLRPEAGLPDEYPLDRLVQILRFRNGTVVRTRTDRRVYLDPGDENETFYAVLYRVFHDGRVTPPDWRVAAVGACWRKVLAAEVEWAADGFFGTRSARATARRLVRNPGEWSRPGAVGLTADAVVFDGPRRRRTSLYTVEAVVRYDAFVWLRRRHAYDWLIRCASEPAAAALAEALRAAVGAG